MTFDREGVPAFVEAGDRSLASIFVGSAEIPENISDKAILRGRPGPFRAGAPTLAHTVMVDVAPVWSVFSQSPRDSSGFGPA